MCFLRGLCYPKQNDFDPPHSSRRQVRTRSSGCVCLRTSHFNSANWRLYFKPIAHSQISRAMFFCVFFILSATTLMMTRKVAARSKLWCWGVAVRTAYPPAPLLLANRLILYSSTWTITLSSIALGPSQFLTNTIVLQHISSHLFHT